MVNERVMVTLPPTVQPLEIVWFLVGCIGLAFAVPLLLSFMRDRRVLRDDGVNGGDTILANLYVGTCWGLVGIELAIVGIGVAAMLTLPAARIVVSRAGVLITIGLVAIALLADFTVFWLSLSRQRLRVYLRRELGAERLRELAALAEALRHDETMAELRHNTAVSTSADEHAEGAEREATAIGEHLKDDATRRGP